MPGTVEVLKVNEDGTAVGQDDQGRIYRGQQKQVGFDQLTVESDLKDGVLHRTASYEGQVISSQTITKDAYIADLAERIKATYLAASGDEAVSEDEAEELALEQATAEWDKEVACTGYEQNFANVYVREGGKLQVQAQEIKVTVYEWEEVS